MAAPRLEILSQPFGGRSLGDTLLSELTTGGWQRFRATVAFLKRSGARQILTPLDMFLRLGGTAEIAVGIDHDGTSLEGLQDLWRVMAGRGKLVVFKEGQGGGLRTFHPKAYVFERADAALAIVGSGNLTAGGLYANHELMIAARLDLQDAASATFHAELTDAIGRWLRPGPASRPVDPRLLRDLTASGELLSEAKIAQAKRAGLVANRQGAAAQVAGRPVAFGASGARAEPPAPMSPPPLAPPVAVSLPTPVRAGGRTTRPAAAVAHHTFLVQVRPHHNGEILLSKRAIDEDPGFFGVPFSGWSTPKKGQNAPYPQLTPDPHVAIVVHDARGRQAIRVSHELNFVYYARKSEFRITIPPRPLARIPQMALLAMTRNPDASHDYLLEFFPPGTSTARYRLLCSHLTGQLPSGGAGRARRYGWV